MNTVYFFGGLHPIQESFFKYPPEGYRVNSNVSVSDVEKIVVYNRSNVALRKWAMLLFNVIQRPRLTYVRQKCNLIHTGSGVFPLNKKPFVVNVEYYASFAGHQHEKARMGKLRQNIIKHMSSPYCKRILPFSEASKRSIVNAYSPESRSIEEKIDVLYPAIAPVTGPGGSKKPDDGKVRILHIGSGFFEKGGRELFRAVERLREDGHPELELHSVTNAPPQHRQRFEQFVEKYRGREGFHVYQSGIPRSILFEQFYSNSDLFVLPSFGDLFGYVFLEAMSCGVPLIGTDVFAIPEIIEDGKNGFLVKTPISPFEPDFTRKTEEGIVRYLSAIYDNEFEGLTNQLMEKIRVMVEDDQLRKRMGRNGLEMVTDGRFSIRRRNSQLKKIYDEALSG